jgi:hypothetical protein
MTHEFKSPQYYAELRKIKTAWQADHAEQPKEHKKVAEVSEQETEKSEGQ